MHPAVTLAEVVAPRKSLLRELLLVTGASLLLAVSARITFYLPFTPVPVSGQTLAVLLTGTVLGSCRGLLSVVSYISLGVAGLPVFAGGAGPGYLAGPTGGYLAGFAAAAYVTGWLAERGWDRKASTAALSMTAGNIMIYLFGLAWLSRLVEPDDLLQAGFYPFLAGDLLKIALATALLPAVWRVARRA